MRKIGEGYHYSVYDLGNNRVLKRQKKKWRVLLYILFVNCFLPRTVREYKNALRNIEETKYVYKGIQERFADLKLFGHPVFLQGIDYEQDKVTIFKKALLIETDESIKLYIHKYIQSIHKLWRRGCHEKVFNFTINTGIEKDGTIVLIDFNEISFDKEDARKDILNQTWKHRWSYTHLRLLLSSREIQDFYQRRMEEELTTEKLESLWEIGLREVNISK